VNAGRPDEPAWVAPVLEFWFREIGQEHWFAATRDLDRQIRTRFLSVHERVVRSDAASLKDARALLAAIVVLDQFSRNMFRGTPRAFAADWFARRLAEQLVDRGLDTDLVQTERYFVYLPFEHSEDRAHQARAVRLIESLGNEIWTRYARSHQSVIERFGRFPHRNAILGRTSSPDELLFLREHGNGF